MMAGCDIPEWSLMALNSNQGVLYFSATTRVTVDLLPPFIWDRLLLEWEATYLAVVIVHCLSALRTKTVSNSLSRCVGFVEQVLRSSLVFPCITRKTPTILTRCISVLGAEWHVLRSNLSRIVTWDLILSCLVFGSPADPRLTVASVTTYSLRFNQFCPDRCYVHETLNVSCFLISESEMYSII